MSSPHRVRPICHLSCFVLRMCSEWRIPRRCCSGLYSLSWRRSGRKITFCLGTSLHIPFTWIIYWRACGSLSGTRQTAWLRRMASKFWMTTASCHGRISRSTTMAIRSSWSQLYLNGFLLFTGVLCASRRLDMVTTQAQRLRSTSSQSSSNSWVLSFSRSWWAVSDQSLISQTVSRT